MPRRGQKKEWSFLAPLSDPEGMPALRLQWVEAMRTRALSEAHVDNGQMYLAAFIVWAQERGITKAKEVTRPVIESYQRFLFYYRKETKDGTEEPLTLRTQIEKLSSLRGFFRWLTRHGYILANPASELELPRIPPQRPPEVLTLAEVEQLLAQPDIEAPYGLRDRAILETLYSTGMRRRELSLLLVSDIETTSGIVRVRHGKGRKERVIPIGSRALAWIHRYLLDVRPQLATPPDDGTLFLTATGKPFHPDTLTQLVRDYFKKAAIAKPGSCHLLRHTMATLMLENGADIRFIQEMLGHATLHATTIYTHVAIKKLKQIHTATHPGANLEAPPAAEDLAGEAPAEASADEQLSSLAARAADERDEDGEGGAG
jgi:integrase/recombinase XerD